LAPDDHLKLIHKHADVYKRFDAHPRGSREHEFFYRLEQLDTTTVYPLLLEVFSRLPEADVRLVLTDLESYLVRRAVCGLTTNAYNRIFTDVLGDLDSALAASTIQNYLLRMKGDASRWPGDEECHRAWIATPVYNKLVRKRLRMILEAVESALITAMTEAVLLDRQLTIEHVMPRSWLEHWPLPSTAGPDASDERDRLVNTFGNLTLATGKLNPSMSNAAWQTKRAELHRHSALALNRDLTRYDTWNEDLIRTRGEQLFEIALRVWPRPAVPVPEDEDEPAQHTERPPTPKEERHLRFWAALLERARGRTSLHESASPRRGIYLAITAGARGLRYYYAKRIKLRLRRALHQHEKRG
jgi:hypothetical protein